MKYYNEEFSCTQTELLNSRLILPLAKLVVISARLISNRFFFFSDTPVDMQLVTFDSYPMLMN